MFLNILCWTWNQESIDLILLLPFDMLLLLLLTHNVELDDAKDGGGEDAAADLALVQSGVPHPGVSDPENKVLPVHHGSNPFVTSHRNVILRKNLRNCSLVSQPSYL